MRLYVLAVVSQPMVVSTRYIVNMKAARVTQDMLVQMGNLVHIVLILGFLKVSTQSHH
jgi:hypothetical protein